MTIIQEIQKQAQLLPQRKQNEVIKFINFLQWSELTEQPAKKRPIKEHPAFGSWRGRGISALKYQQELRAEWDGRV